MSLDRLGHYRKKVFGPRNQSSLVVESPQRGAKSNTHTIDLNSASGEHETPSTPVNFEGTFFSSTKPRRLLDFSVHPEWISERIIRPRYSVDSVLYPSTHPSPNKQVNATTNQSPRASQQDSQPTKGNSTPSAPSAHSSTPPKGRLQTILMQRSLTLPPIKRSSSAPPYLKAAKNPVTWQDWW